MASNVVSIIISIVEKGQAVISSVESGMNKLNSTSKAYQSTLQSVNGHVDKFQQGLQRLVSIVAGFNIAKSFIDTAASFEKTKLMLEGLSGSAEQAEKDFAWIKDFAKSTPFDIQSVSDAFVKLQVAGIDPTSGALQTLTDSVAAFGGGSDELKRVSIAIGQMAGKGVISMEELRQQIGEVLPDAMKSMAAEMGKSLPELSKLIETGSLDAKTGLEALFSGLEKAHKGAGERMMSGWKGVMAQLQAAWQEVQDALMKAGVFDALKSGIKELTDALKTESFSDAAKSLGSAVKTILTDLVSFARGTADLVKNLGPLGSALSSSLPTLIQWVAAWKLAKIALGAIVGIPLSIYREIKALGAALTVLTGLSVVSWCQTLAFQVELLAANFINLPRGISTAVGAFGALGLAIAGVWAVGKITELIKAIKDLFQASDQLDATKKKYQKEAEALKEFRDFKVRTLQEFKLMEDEQLRDEKTRLDQSVQYWTKYKEGLLLQFEQLWGGATGSPEGGFIDIEAMAADQAAIRAAQEQIDALMAELSKLGQAARANEVDLNAQTKAIRQSGEAAKTAAEFDRHKKITADQLKEANARLTNSYNAIVKAASNYFDFNADKVKASVSDEKKAAGQILELYRQKKDFIINQAELTADAQLKYIGKTKGNEAQIAEDTKKVHEDLKNAKIKALEDYRSKLQSSLLQALGDEKNYAAEVKKLQADLRTAQMTYQDRVRELQRKTMTEDQAWMDRRKEALQTEAAAREALSKATAETDPTLQSQGYQQAIDLAKKAQEQASSLATEVKKGEQTVITMQQGVNAAMKIMQPAEATLEEAIRKQTELAQKNQTEAKNRAEQFQKEIDVLTEKIKEVNETPIEPKATIKVDSEEVDAKLRELDGKVTRSTHIIDVSESGGSGGGSSSYTYGDSDTYEGSAAEKYWNEYYGFKLGGLIQPLAALVARASQPVKRLAEGGFNRIRGALGGWGGGDRIRALLEAGEFVIRKEAVAKYGAGFFDLLNNMTLNLPGILEAISMPPQIPRTAYAEGGSVIASGIPEGGPSETITWRWQLNDKEYPLTLTGPRGTATLMRDLEKELSRAGLTRSRA